MPSASEGERPPEPGGDGARTSPVRSILVRCQFDRARRRAAAVQAGSLVPGLLAAGVGIAAARTLSGLVPGFSALTAAVLLGAIFANSLRLPRATGPGLQFAAKRLLKAGVVLLGFRLAVSDLLRLGGTTLLVVVAIVVLTFLGTRWAGKLLRVGRDLSLLVATGFAVCGASAIAAMTEVTNSDEDDAAYAIALVTLCGSLAILVLPLLARTMNLGAEVFGAWAGASVHDVGQVVATAATGGRDALRIAIVVKLVRVVLLAPIIVVVAIARRRQLRQAAGGQDRATLTPIPLFVVAFLAAVSVRSTGLLSGGWLDAIGSTEALLLGMALFGLGTEVRLERLRRVGGRPLVLGLVAWMFVAGAALIGVQLTMPRSS